ncbi:PREDICTED: uncharacterized protein LOC108760084 [Trachymyrmex cornetzi]|uniref:uncharacterized protein LOC108760084 n=1 Tax=Trachymyrmex cornetzi TaxID=471704 RepID=UPI00084F4782|nr:PREDICTED: uncharacterized protein LOC108760084 [Trachymyrmex cornetzi]
MGLPLSPIIADLVMRRLERLSLMSFNRSCPFYYRYVDDICTAVTPSDIEALLQAFNSFHPRLQFTIEIGGDKLEFLDVTIFRLNSKLIFDRYRKPFFSGRFLNFNSNHPVSQKKGTIYSLVDRAFILSDCSFHTKNLIFVINILLENDYLLPFIFNTVNQRIKQLLKTKYMTQDNSTENLNDVQSSSWLMVPFIPHHTERFKRFSNNDVRVSFHSPNKMAKYIKVQKDSLSKNSKNNVVYKISCENCDASYVGQTDRQLKTRISEHRNHIRHNASTLSVITEHRLQYGHEFQWDNIEILDEEPCYRKRLVSEMLNIKRQKNSLNLQTDTEGLHKAYIPIINKF